LASIAGHAFWAVPADDAFIAQLLFFKNIAVTGGLLMLASSGAGFISFDSPRAKGWQLTSIKLELGSLGYSLISSRARKW